MKRDASLKKNTIRENCEKKTVRIVETHTTCAVFSFHSFSGSLSRDLRFHARTIHVIQFNNNTAEWKYFQLIPGSGSSVMCAKKKRFERERNKQTEKNCKKQLNIWHAIYWVRANGEGWMNETAEITLKASKKLALMASDEKKAALRGWNILLHFLFLNNTNFTLGVLKMYTTHISTSSKFMYMQK